MLQIRHYIRDTYKNTGAVKAIIRLTIAILTPFISFILYRSIKDSKNQSSITGIYTSTNHFKSLAEHEILQEKSYIQIKIGSEKVNTDNQLMDSKINYDIIKKHFKVFCILLAKLARKKISITRVALASEFLIYHYTYCILTQLNIKPTKVIVADSFSPRMIATIDYFQAMSVTTEMIQHGLIQIPKKYKSHADIYSLWSKYEYEKVKPYLGKNTIINIIGREYKLQHNLNTTTNNECLIVMNPYQGIGQKYDQDIINFFISLEKISYINIRLHPSDNITHFTKQIQNIKNINISNSSWEDDLKHYSHFTVFNSSCLIDILMAEKNVATLMLKNLKYSPPAVAHADLIPDISTPNELIRFIMASDKQEIRKKILSTTLGI